MVNAAARCSLVVLAIALLAAPLFAAEPDYSGWDAILARHYDPARGMDYASLKANRASLDRLRADLSRVNVAALTRDEQLAYWLNLYNISVVALVVDRYPVDSIRDLSTDPIIRFNVFKRDFVRVGNENLSLDDIEHVKIRQAFRDPRIHFAINCAARSCPPLSHEAFRGARVSQQLDAATRQFIQRHVRVVRDGDGTTLRTTRIMEWFEDDFEAWGGGTVSFLRKYLAAELGGKVAVKYDDYDWALNDWKR